jgi:hypothetical protein
MEGKGLEGRRLGGHMRMRWCLRRLVSGVLKYGLVGAPFAGRLKAEVIATVTSL